MVIYHHGSVKEKEDYLETLLVGRTWFGPVALSPWVTVDPCRGYRSIKLQRDQIISFGCIPNRNFLSPVVTVDPCRGHFSQKFPSDLIILRIQLTQNCRDTKHKPRQGRCCHSWSGSGGRSQCPPPPWESQDALGRTWDDVIIVIIVEECLQLLIVRVKKWVYFGLVSQLHDMSQMSSPEIV